MECTACVITTIGCVVEPDLLMVWMNAGLELAASFGILFSVLYCSQIHEFIQSLGFFAGDHIISLWFY